MLEVESVASAVDGTRLVEDDYGSDGFESAPSSRRSSVA